MKSVLWRVAKRLSYIEDARRLKVNICNKSGLLKILSVCVVVTKGSSQCTLHCVEDILSLYPSVDTR